MGGGEGERGGSAGPRVGQWAPASSPRPPIRRSPLPCRERARCAGRGPWRRECARGSVGAGPRQAEPHAPPRPPSRGWRQVSGCRGTATPRRKQDAAEIRLLTCSCAYPGLIKAELPVVTLLPPPACQPRALPAAARALTDRQKPVLGGPTPGPGVHQGAAQHRLELPPGGPHHLHGGHLECWLTK